MHAGDESIGVHMIASNGKNKLTLDSNLSCLLELHRCNHFNKNPTINKPTNKKPIPMGMYVNTYMVMSYVLCETAAPSNRWFHVHLQQLFLASQRPGEKDVLVCCSVLC